MKSKIWISSPHMGGNELKYIYEAFDSNWIAPLGPNVTGFEQDLKAFLNTEKEVGVLSSGTAAIHLALILLGVKNNDEVLCQSLTFSASANPIVYQGATPIFIDSETDTWNMCPNHLEEAMKDSISKGKKPKAIILVHLYGMPAKLDEILAISKKYEIPLIEDAAEAIGSVYKGKKCGTFGDFGILSFNGNKIITTSGGGALVCKSQEDKQKAIFLGTQARDEAEHYQHSEIGYNYRMTELQAALGVSQMSRLSEFVAARHILAARYNELMVNLPITLPYQLPNTYSGLHLFVIRLNLDEVTKTHQQVFDELRENGIGVNLHYIPVHTQPYYQKLGFKLGDFPASECYYKEAISLPMFHLMTEKQQDEVVFVLNNILQGQ